MIGIVARVGETFAPIVAPVTHASLEHVTRYQF